MARAIRIHYVDLAKVRDVILQLHLFLVREILATIRIPNGAKHNLTAIRRIRTLSIVPERVG